MIAARSMRLGLRANLAQFSLLVGVNALVGGMLGQERTVLPLIATRVFHLHAYSAALTYIVAFGVVKAVTNFVAGTISERVGRKPVLVAGWLVAAPVPFLLGWGPGWAWIVVANVLLGVSQGLTWSTTVIMKIDLVGPERRGLAMGFNEAAGYGAVALTALATGFVAARAGLRPDPFFLGIAFAGLGLGLSTLFVRETLAHARHEASSRVVGSPALPGELSTRQVFALTSFKDKALSSASQAGLVNNLNDGLAWGIFPLLFAQAGLSVGRIGVLAALYPAVWGLGQLATGALSDRVGRKWLIAAGMWTQAVAIGCIASGRGLAQLSYSAPAPPWCIRRCLQPSATWHTPPGGQRRSASTGCGGTPGSRWAPSWRGWWPTCSGSTLRSGSWPPLLLPRGSSWRSACTRPTIARASASWHPHWLKAV
jgi:MFS family permease